MYERNCGLENVLMSWGHDEYLHMVLRNHPGCTLPEEAFYVIRFHSFYPWHTGMYFRDVFRSLVGLLFRSDATADFSDLQFLSQEATTTIFATTRIAECSNGFRNLISSICTRNPRLSQTSNNSFPTTKDSSTNTFPETWRSEIIKYA